LDGTAEKRVYRRKYLAMDICENGTRLLKHATRWMVAAALCLSIAYPVSAPGAPAEPDRGVKQRELPGSYPSAPSKPPAFSIPVEPLGFSAPGPIYLGERNAMASLNFIGETRLLFTFRVPGLIRRNSKPGEKADSDIRQIRALVINISTGAVEAEALWTVHDRSRYLWMLNDGHFLLRDKENLSEGDSQLELKPLLRFPGRLLRIGLDPGQQYIVSNSIEPPEPAAKSGEVGSPATASATVTPEEKQPDPAAPEFVVRIIQRESGKVMLVSRTRGMVHLPINSEGYIENLRGRESDWNLNLNYFTGGSHMLGTVVSTCAPNNEFISEKVLLATGCDGSGAIKLVAFTTEGRILWDELNPVTAVWPVQFHSVNGLRIAFETLTVTHAVGPYSPLADDDIKGQLLRILNTATGEIAFESPVSPVLDMGGNAAISPTARRVAVVNAGAIQVFDLPAPPPIPDPPNQRPSH
jgi:hypothetical protein